MGRGSQRDAHSEVPTRGFGSAGLSLAEGLEFIGPRARGVRFRGSGSPETKIPKHRIMSLNPRATWEYKGFPFWVQGDYKKT